MPKETGTETPDTLAPLPVIEPKDALAFFRAKGLQIGFSWLDVQREEHDKAFTVAKAMTRELLEDIRAAMDAAIAEGQTLKMFVANLRPTMEAKGWWGKKPMLDPATGQIEAAQLGSPNRLRVIYRTNMRTSHAAGRWARIQRTKKSFPLLRYVSVMDGRERDEHRAWHNTVLPVDDPWWETHCPPCDWGCRCRAIPLNQRMLDKKKLTVTEKPKHFGTRQVINKRTGEIRTIEKGIGAGWDYHPGRSVLAGITPEPLPTGFGDEAAAAVYPRTVFDRAFGLMPHNGFQSVWTDKAGWPLAITGRMTEGESATRIAQMVRTLTDPDEIRWAWVRDESGAVVAMRRYVRGTIMLDVGRLGWRIGRARAGGKTVWERGQSVAAGFNPNQPRDRNGKWTSPGRFAQAAMTDPVAHNSLYLGRAPKGGPTDVSGFPRSMQTSGVVHAMRKHGPGGTGKDANPISERDFDLVPLILQRGKASHRKKRTVESLMHRLEINGVTHVYVERIGRKRGRLTMKTFYKEGDPGE